MLTNDVDSMGCHVQCALRYKPPVHVTYAERSKYESHVH